MTQKTHLSVHLKPQTWETPSDHLKVGIMPLRVSRQHLCTFLNPHALIQLNGNTEAAPSLRKSLFAGTWPNLETILETHKGAGPKASERP